MFKKYFENQEVLKKGELRKFYWIAVVVSVAISLIWYAILFADDIKDFFKKLKDKFCLSKKEDEENVE